MNYEVPVPRETVVDRSNVYIMHLWMHAAVSSLEEDAEEESASASKTMRRIHVRRKLLIDQAVEDEDYEGLTEALKELREDVCNLSIEGRKTFGKRISYSKAFANTPMVEAICD